MAGAGVQKRPKGGPKGVQRVSDGVTLYNRSRGYLLRYETYTRKTGSRRGRGVHGGGHRFWRSVFTIFRCLHSIKLLLEGKIKAWTWARAAEQVLLG